MDGVWLCFAPPNEEDGDERGHIREGVERDRQRRGDRLDDDAGDTQARDRRDLDDPRAPLGMSWASVWPW